MLLVLLGASFLGALLNTDRQALAQSMIGRPLPAGFLISLLWQDEIYFGLWLGLWAELWWSGKLPLGGSVAPNGSLAVVTTACGLFLARKMGWADWSDGIVGAQALITLGGLILPPLGYLATKLDSIHRAWSAKLAIFFEQKEKKGIPVNRFLGQIAALCWTVATGFVAIFLFSVLIALIVSQGSLWGLDFIKIGLSSAFPLITILGFASLLTNMPRFSALFYYGVGLLLGLFTLMI